MTANPPLRAAIWLGFTAVAGVGGWAGGRAAREGLNPDGRTARHLSSLQPTVAGPREPRVEPGTAEGNWMARVKAADSSDFAALLEELDTLLPREGRFSEREAAQKWLLALWISKDADAAVACVAGKQDKFLSSTFGLVLGSVAPEKVAAILAGPFKNDLGEYFPSAALHSLATADPREFLKLQSDKNAGGSPWIRNWPRALAALAESDPSAAAAAWNAAGTNEPSRNSSLFSILRIWTEHDVKGARQWAEGLTDEKDRQLARHAWLGTLARRDPRAALKELAGMDAGEYLPEQPGNHNGRAGSLSDARVEIVAALARQSLPEALAVMQEMMKTMKLPAEPAGPPDSQRNDPLAVMRKALVTAAAPGLPNEPAQLLPALRNLSADPAMELLLFNAKITNWNATATLDAVNLLAADAGSADRNEMLSSALKHAVRSDPDKTVSALVALPKVVQGIAAHVLLWSVDGTNTALMQQIVPLNPPDQWAEGNGQALAAAPEQNAAIVAALPLSAHARTARYGFAEQWGKQDPDAAAQWVASLPQDRGTVEAARGLTNAWAGFDDTAASAWAESLPPGQARDGAALGLASGLGATEPEAAWHWAAAISNPELAADAFWSVARHWGNQAPEEFRVAFSAALDRGGYGGDIKAGALRDLEKPPGSHLGPQAP